MIYSKIVYDNHKPYNPCIYIGAYDMGNKFCEIDNCSKSIFAKSLCSAHYKSLYRHGHTNLISRHDVCQVTKCGKAHLAKGYCQNHYRKFKRNGELLDAPKPETKICMIEDCFKKHEAHGYCDTHYKRFKKHGNPFFVTPKDLPKYSSIRERFENSIEIITESGCWIWIKACKPDGYGCLRWENKMLVAHRVAYELYVDKIPNGMLVCHKCDIPACCNPKHLFLGTHKDNAEDKDKKNRGKYLKGSLCGSSKLDEKTVKEIRLKLKAGVRGSVLAREYNLCRSTISQIKRITTWKHLS